MRTFHSYGPVDSTEHYCVDRKENVMINKIKGD
ncbi:hypothetical protein MHK_010572 [Candidatus Magnetomorum sp. HK-1]|nr:hypothetical protein MHK_010572 [Candidatus Magnetomorum sp. HK-1]